jgi:hypothetical protein
MGTLRLRSPILAPSTRQRPLANDLDIDWEFPCAPPSDQILTRQIPVDADTVPRHASKTATVSTRSSKNGHETPNPASPHCTALSSTFYPLGPPGWMGHFGAVWGWLGEGSQTRLPILTRSGNFCARADPQPRMSKIPARRGPMTNDKCRIPKFVSTGPFRYSFRPLSKRYSRQD